MDRFIVIYILESVKTGSNLKSNMDRFIGNCEAKVDLPIPYLKSNMDRFIEIVAAFR